VDKPEVEHYQQGDIEPIEYIRAMGKEVYTGYCVGNVIKYVSRYRHKGTAAADLRKARDYLDWLIVSIDSEK